VRALSTVESFHLFHLGQGLIKLANTVGALPHEPYIGSKAGVEKSGKESGKGESGKEWEAKRCQEPFSWPQGKKVSGTFFLAANPQSEFRNPPWKQPSAIGH
jgi:hypothetical protein